jgi:dTDP-4-dehydrorhamnose reductase
MRVLSPHFDLVGLDIEELDITVEADTLQTIQEVSPTRVVHAAAQTDVDSCETDSGMAFRVNSQGTLHVARACHSIGARMLYISTDYVFDGTASRPYTEKDPVKPLSVYGQSKLEGEQHVRNLLEEFTIVRTQWLFGEKGKNFVTTILNLAQKGNPLTVVNDQVGSPTYTKDLSLAILRLLETGCRGVFHAANSSFCSWYDFARAIVKSAGIRGVKITPMDSTCLKRPAPRPHYSIFDCSKLIRETGLTMRPWHEALQDFLNGRDLE